MHRRSRVALAATLALAAAGLVPAAASAYAPPTKRPSTLAS